MERAIIANRKHDKGEVRKEMSERKMKRVEDSLTEQSHLLMPKCLNAAGYLFGGQLLAWIDETAGIDHNGICLCLIVYDLMTSGCEKSQHLLRVCQVFITAKRDE